MRLASGPPKFNAVLHLFCKPLPSFLSSIVFKAAEICFAGGVTISSKATWSAAEKPAGAAGTATLGISREYQIRKAVCLP
jgi:hypothetical protein